MRLPSVKLSCLLAALLVPHAHAQSGGAPGAITLTTSASYSGRTDLDHEGRPVGDVAVTGFQFAAESSTGVGERGQFGYGVDYAHLGLDGSPAAPLPEELQALSLPLSFSGQLSPAWMGRLVLRPGLYGDALAFSARQFNVPVVALLSFRQTPELSWAFGLRYDDWSEYPLLPFAGVNWKFAPDWEFTLGVPRSGVSWQFHRNAILRLGASFQGGSFAVSDDPRPVGSPLPFVGRTKLDYREIRVGGALDLFAREAVGVVLDAGVIVSQRFDYDRSDVRVDGDSALYVSVAARFRF